MEVTMSQLSATAARTTETIRVWDLPVRLFHWLLVATILIAFISAEEESALAAWHVPAGWIAAVLIFFRIVWGFIGGEHARFADFLRPGQIVHHVRGMLARTAERSIGHNAAGGLAIIALLGTVAGVVYTGATMRGESGESLHEAIANGLLALIAVHVLAVVATSLLTRENLVGAFITGNKRADKHPGAHDARPPATAAIPVAVAAVGIAIYGTTLIDPAAFTPGAHIESDEGDDAVRGNDDD